MKGVGGALFMAALLVLYIVLVGVRAVQFLAVGGPIATGIGIALLILPAIGLFLLVRELQFGVRSGRMVRILNVEGDLPGDDLPRRPSGRVDRDAADAVFDTYRHAAEVAPTEWRAWLRLGLAYDASGDRRRARAAVRQAIALFRA